MRLMPPDDLDLDLIAPEAIPGVRVMPVLHERVDLAGVVGAVLDEVDPAVVAVELPTTLAEAAERAMRRLPRISIVLSEEEEEEALAWVVAPGDPLAEGLRWAAERGRRWTLVDPDVPYRARRRDALPDPHAAWTLGWGPYLETLRRIAGGRPADDADRLRERGMAHHLRRLADETEGEVVALVGAAHAARLADDLREPTAEPFARQRRATVILRNLHPESLTGVMTDAPLLHAVHELLRDGGPPPDAPLADAVSRRVELVRAGLRVITGESGDDARQRIESVVRYAASRGACQLGERWVPDRSVVARALWSVASASYAEQTRESTAPWQERMFFDFARRCSRVGGQLVPGLYEWVVAARGVADDNLGWEVFDAARAYPWQAEAADLETARVDGDMLDLGTRKVRFRRRFFRVKQRLVPVPVRRRPTTDDPAEWLEGFTGEGICSYPPEDVVVEDYGRFLQAKAVSILSAERTRVEPFTTSMLDGIDIRQTLLKWHEGRVWVREHGRAPGAAGSVVVIFDDDPDGTRYPYLMSWLGEHDQESDMAFYATDPADQIVGPGITRATYGGFMLTTPRGRLFNVWSDPDYRTARGKAEVLLMAAIDYSTEKLVVHAAPSPPSDAMRSWAAAQRKRIVHVPLGSLSPVTLKKLRVVHILAGRDKREIAKDYVW